MELLIYSLMALFVYMSGLFVVSLLLKNNGVADIGYGLAFIVVILAAFFQIPILQPFMIVMVGLPFIWAVRLATRIYLKNKGRPEDFRYKAWRDSWGKSFTIRSFFQVYMLQGLVVFIVSLPVTLALIYQTAFINTGLFYFSLSLWALGFFFEAVGDYQLDKFINNPQNKGLIMTQGLWKYTRHPNYFGESTMWFALAIMSISISSAPSLVFLSPLLITFLLIKVSGVPLLEKKWEGHPDWEIYKKNTSVFLPLPSKKN